MARNNPNKDNFHVGIENKKTCTHSMSESIILSRTWGDVLIIQIITLNT